MNKLAKVVLWIVLVAVIGIIVVVPRLRRSLAAAPVAQSENKTLPVTVYRVVPQKLADKILVNGNILADEEAELRSELAGRVVAITFREGSTVELGVPLVKINDTEYQAEKQRLTHEIRLARDMERRQANLLGKGGTSQENYDRAINRLNTLKAQLAVVAARLEKTVIRAPFDGIMGFRHISEGSYVASNTRIAAIKKIDPVKIEFAIPEKYAGKVATGNRIQFRLPGREKDYEGEVYAIEPRIDPATRSLPIRAIAPNPGHSILPGSFASVSLVFEEIGDALMVPSEALVPSLGSRKVFVLEDGHAREREVKTGIRTATMVQVTAGLQAGEAVIRTGILQVRDGLAVRVLNESGPEEGGR